MIKNRLVKLDAKDVKKLLSGIACNSFNFDSKRFERSFRFKRAAVIVPFYVNENQEVCIVLVVRSTKLLRHPGQISFPGGEIDENETILECALREAKEEISLKKEFVEVLGFFYPEYTYVSNFLIYPVLGWVELKNKPYEFKPDGFEVEKIIFVPFLYLLNSKPVYKSFYHKENKVTFPEFCYKDYVIWGATARIIDNLRKRMLKEIMLKRKENQ